MDNLCEVRERLAGIPPLESKLKDANARLQKLEEEVRILLEKYEKEKRDVERLENESISAFLYRYIGKYEDKMEKEEKEELEAKRNYDAAVSDKASIEQERDALQARLSTLRAEEVRYKDELERRRVRLKSNLQGEVAQKHNELEEQNQDFVAQRFEIKEAQMAIYNAIVIAAEAKQSLDSARSWATYDIWLGDGILSHMAKYDHIDKSEECFNRLHYAIHAAKKELGDINDISDIKQIEISSGQRMVDFWFDNIFTDMSVRNQLEENIHKTEILISDLQNKEKLLDIRLKKLEEQIEQNRQEEQNLLAGLE